MHFRVHAGKREDGEGQENALTLTLRHVSYTYPWLSEDTNSASGRRFSDGRGRGARVL
jgi:hypothetical protein